MNFPYFYPYQDFYPNPDLTISSDSMVPTFSRFAQQSTIPAEESYVENILRMNRGKVATIYMTFENNSEWNAKIFRGVVETAGRDHIIISEPETGRRYILLMVNLDYITFDEQINYVPPSGKR